METFSLNPQRILTADDARTHSHKSWLLVYVLSGSATLRVEGQNAPLSAGAFVIIPPDMPYSWEFSAEVEVRSLNMAASLPEALAALMPELEPVAAMLAGRDEVLAFRETVSATAGRIIGTMQFESDARRAASLLEVLVRLSAERNPAVAAVSRYKVAASRRASKLDAYIAATGVSEISLEKAAGVLGMKHSAFCVFFKKAYGTTFVEYVNRKRVEKACKLLSRGGHATVEVMRMVGFRSMPHFINTFSRIMGATPARWAKQHQGHSK